ncbi:MAG: endonuclease/exonuclease/phosphatase family protein [Bacteroidota bacterium]
MKESLSIFLLLIIFGQKLAAQIKDADQVIVKVLSFNIYHGETMKGNFDLDVLANLIKEADPDFVALQEVDFLTNRAKKYDLVTELAWRTKMAGIFGKAMDYDGGAYGEGLLSKYPFLKSRNVALPTIKGQEPRAALEVLSILPSGDTIAFIGTHFAHEGKEGRLLQAKKINEVFSQNPYPTILAGDLNAQPGSLTIHTLEEIWQATYDKEYPAFTYPSDDPKIKIDYVMFYPKNRWRIIETKVIADTVASDHCAYLVSLELIGE